MRPSPRWCICGFMIAYLPMPSQPSTAVASVQPHALNLKGPPPIVIPSPPHRHSAPPHVIPNGVRNLRSAPDGLPITTTGFYVSQLLKILRSALLRMT